MKPLFSVIIPVRHPTDYLEETVRALDKQSLNNFELLVITDKIAGNVSPAIKRNLGAKMAKGEYLAFLDDDSYPSSDWLKNARKHFSKNITAVCGPCLTPPSDDVFRQASGLVWSSFLGSGGAGEYRNNIAKPRFVDDFPSVNLIVKKSDFLEVKGFNTHHWPGEDTILCLDLTHKLHKKIFYHPSVQVFHHRRKVIIPHLQQITRYAIHRGLFAKIYPQTSLRIGYILPSLFIIYLLLLPLLPKTFLIPLFIYLLLLLFTFFNFILKNSLIVSLLATITIPITHLYYGIFFIRGLFKNELKFIPL
ncbi:MAG: glycosyltransferase [Candidatus Shapirobacteria bacterium]|jgi:glycosyltransferase involved in cell wall biosynthesis